MCSRRKRGEKGFELGRTAVGDGRKYESDSVRMHPSFTRLHRHVRVVVEEFGEAEVADLGVPALVQQDVLRLWVYSIRVVS